MPLLQSDRFYCEHLGANENDRQDILTFSVRDERGEGLVNYLRHFAFPDEKSRDMRTYLVRNNRTSELAGYFSLKAGLASLNEEKTGERVEFDIMPGIELANFAVNNGYIQRHPDSKGVGLSIFNDFIWSIVVDVSERIGVKIVYLFALPFEGLIQRYIHYGFTRLEARHEEELHQRLKPRYDSKCIFMYQML